MTSQPTHSVDPDGDSAVESAIRDHLPAETDLPTPTAGD